MLPLLSLALHCKEGYRLWSYKLPTNLYQKKHLVCVLPLPSLIVPTPVTVHITILQLSVSCVLYLRSPPQRNHETRTWVQVVYLGRWFQKHFETVREGHMKGRKASKTHSKWAGRLWKQLGLGPLWETLCYTLENYFNVSFIHQLPSLMSWELLLRH